MSRTPKAPTPTHPEGLRLLVVLPDLMLEEGFWEAFKAWQAQPNTPKPILVLVSEAQYDAAPRGLDKIQGLTVRAVESADLASMLRQTVEAGGLVAAPAWQRESVPFDQWLAVWWRRGTWEESPAQWRPVWQSTGRLPGLSTPAHRLADLDFGPAKKVPALPEGPALRDYLVGLAIGDARIPPDVRLGHAELLGVEAGATADEVAAFQRRRKVAAAKKAAEQAALQRQREDAAVENAAVQAGLEVRRLASTELQDLMRRARYQATQGVVGVEERWHWINAAPAEDLAPGRIEVHTIEVQPTALDRLWAEVKGWTTAQLEADPWLAGAAARLDPEGIDSMAFRLARAWLLLGRTPAGWPAKAPVTSPLIDSPAALRAILAQPSPRAELRLTPTDDSVWFSGPASHWEDQTLGIWRSPSAGQALWLGRGQMLWRTYGGSAGYARISKDGERRLSSFLPKSGCQSMDPVKFAQALDLLPSSLGTPKDSRSYLDSHLDRMTAPANELWPVADRIVAQLRRRLRTLLLQGEVDVLHDGTALLPLAPGVDAQVVVYRGTHGGPGAALTVLVNARSSGFAEASLFGPAISRPWLQFRGGYESPNSADITIELPHALYLRDAEHEAVVTFVPNPFSG
jgi:hypothetical protein